MTAVAIFVKTPGISPLKTRLAAEIGKRQAEALYLASAHAVAEVATDAQIGPVYWAVAEKAAVDHPEWQGRPVIEQGEGGLGRRMCRVHTALANRHGSCILLGADAPQIRTSGLREADQWLQQDTSRLAIGPASDGGFWLFGANRSIATTKWEQVSYSRSDTGKHFRAAMERLGDWLELETLTDLDTGPDIVQLRLELEQLPVLQPRQAELLDTLLLAGNAA